MRSTTALLVIALLLAGCGSDSGGGEAPPPSGALDATFGTGGRVTVRPFNVSDMKVDPAGNTYIGASIAGRGSVEKLRADGRPDPTFGDGGLVPIGATALALDAAGNLYVGGGRSSPRGTSVTKLDPLGRVIPAFGDAGVAFIAPLTDGFDEA